MSIRNRREQSQDYARQRLLPDLQVSTSAEIVRALYTHHAGIADWLAFHELRIGTGYGHGADQRIDFWAIRCLPSKAFHRVSYEIKVSRSDFLAEIKDPLKRRFALLLSNQFYFVTPPGLVQPAEIPPECGLREVWHDPSETRYPYRVETVVAAPERDTPGPSWRFLSSIVRRALNKPPVQEQL